MAEASNGDIRSMRDRLGKPKDTSESAPGKGLDDGHARVSDEQRDAWSIRAPVLAKRRGRPRRSPVGRAQGRRYLTARLLHDS